MLSFALFSQTLIENILFDCLVDNCKIHGGTLDESQLIKLILIMGGRFNLH